MSVVLPSVAWLYSSTDVQVAGDSEQSARHCSPSPPPFHCSSLPTPPVLPHRSGTSAVVCSVPMVVAGGRNVHSTLSLVWTRGSPRPAGRVAYKQPLCHQCWAGICTVRLCIGTCVCVGVWRSVCMGGCVGVHVCVWASVFVYTVISYI